ncbi:MAG: DNA-directed RNA polymerase subunit omega [Gammaproteobacteria bacterium]|nr:DNA-directed RNA polymerase subunit omega [Gammaproteobacteria bacterium]MDD9824313.1 DNA-directed RNA polymerase subunit omega [Gammaproteobacteria bacterium]MDD9864205.1 DNA-directed RNA polymerase subunit omega [Gammaproteobacteria bacterium]
MARLTVEDCLEKIPNRYDLVLLASKRARPLNMGKDSLLEEETDEKPTVIALREVAAGLVTQENVDNPGGSEPGAEEPEAPTPAEDA